MSEHKCTAQTWANAIASMIKEAEKDGWVVGIGIGEGRYSLEVYDYSLKDGAEVEW